MILITFQWKYHITYQKIWYRKRAWFCGAVVKWKESEKRIGSSGKAALHISLSLSVSLQSSNRFMVEDEKITSKRFDYGKRNLASLAPLLTVNHHGLGPPNVCRENDSQVSRHFNLTLSQHFLASSKSPLTIGHNQAPDKVPKVHGKMTRLLPVER